MNKVPGRGIEINGNDTKEYRMAKNNKRSYRPDILAYLFLKDGTTFEGYSLGVPGTTVGEVVFSTAMTGYQETLTDYCYYG